MLLGGLIVAFHLGNALVGKSLFRAQHLGTALEYARGPINLLRPVIVGFDATGAPSALEPPLWQAAAALAFKATGSTWYGWANLVSLILFATGLWPFWRLARHYVGERAAAWSVVFFLSQPLVVTWAGMASTDGFCLALTLWFLFFADQMIRTGRAGWWWPTAFLAGLGAVSKAPFFMAAGLFSLFILLAAGRRRWQLWILLAGAGAVALAAFFAWNRYTDSLMAQALYPYLDLRVSHNSAAAAWYFGDMHFRLSPGAWIKGGWRFLHATLGSMPLVALLIAALMLPGNRLPKLWLLATFLTTLVFTSVVLIHWHYYLMCCPAVAMLCGATLARWEDSWTQLMPKRCISLALAGLVLVLSAIDGVIATKIAIYYDPFPAEMASLIRQSTSPQDKLLVYGADWGGQELFRAERKGFCVLNLETPTSSSTVKGLYDILASDEDLHRLKALGYNKLVLLSESPVRFAATAINPTSKRRRIYYPPVISRTVDAWPVVYRSDDLLIKEIP